VITEDPAVTPVTIPVVPPTVAFVLLLLHVPVPASDNVLLSPIQISVTPAIEDGKGLIVIITATLQPVGNVYVITDVPATTPVKIPVEEPTVALLLLLLHVPLTEASLKVVADPTHTFNVPVMDAGNGSTISVVVR
jgi:hypothetical protein